jgi:hypothetical protein
MPKKAGTRTAPPRKRQKASSRFLTRAHREEQSLDEEAIAKVLKELKHGSPGKGKPSRG